MHSRFTSRLAPLAFGLCAAAAGCDDGARPTAAMTCLPPRSTVCPGPVPSFAATIVPILDASCNGCHDPTIPGAPWPLRDHDDVLDWRDLIQTDLLACSMPPRNSDITLSEVDRQQLLIWIACGSPDN